MGFSSQVKQLVDHGDYLYGQRQDLMNLWQEIADLMYVERADFTVSRSWGDNFADHLTTSFPLLARRELGDSFAAMNRPTGQAWFHTGINRVDRTEEERRYLEALEKTQRRAMYDRKAMFARATKEGDHDYAAFGQAVLSTEINKATNTLLYRCWHLRDVAWVEGDTGDVDAVYRRWKTTPRTVVEKFGRDKVSPDLAKRLEKDPFGVVNCRHMVVKAADYEEIKGRKVQTPFVSIWVDTDNEHVMEEIGVKTKIYTIPRWQTVSNSQYAYSPATVAALPDARLIQEITLTLLTAGQKFVDPPMIAVKNAIRDDLDMVPGGVTWVDEQYDERLGEVLRPLSQDRHGMPLGLDITQDTREMISRAFYLNKLNMPTRGPEMTAYEVSQRVQEYIRNALPLFEPMETDYNGSLCDITFDTLQAAGAFGPPRLVPESLRNEEITFSFESPLHDAIEAVKPQIFLESKSLLTEAAAMDPIAPQMVDARKALRDALHGVGTPAEWMRDEQEMKEIEIAASEKQQAQEALEQVQAGAQVAQELGGAGQAMGDAGMAIEGAVNGQV